MTIRFAIPLDEIEREHILVTLRRCNGNRTRAAKFLGISIRSLRMKLAEYSREGFSVPEACSGAPVPVIAPLRPTKSQPCLDAHVRHQLGLSLRIFYAGLLSDRI